MDEKERSPENIQENEAPAQAVSEDLDFSLEDIMKEFGSEEEATPEVTSDTQVLPQLPKEAVSEPAEFEDTRAFPIIKETVSQDTMPFEPVSVEENAPAEKKASSVTGDTIRLDTSQFTHGQVRDAEPIREEPEAFTGSWEPEYEQPMGEYIPPQPIIAHPRSRLRELKRKLVAGPEKKYYELTELGVGRLQLSIFLCFLTAVAALVLTVAHHMGLFSQERARFVAFGQLFLMLLAALLGSFQLIEGAADLFKKRFTLNTLLVFTFGFCCVDAALCLPAAQVSSCGLFTLEMFMSLWSAYHRRVTQLGMMDTMRKAVRLDKLCAVPDYYEGKKGLLRGEGQVEDFMDNYDVPSAQEKIQWWFALSALLVSLGIGVYGYLTADLATGIHLTTGALLAAVPSTAFISLSRPIAVLEKQLHALGAVLCGWKGVKSACGNAVFPVTHQDLFPAGSAKMNGVKFFGSREPDEIIAYCTALVTADGSGLAPLFNQVLDSRNGRHYDAEDLESYDGGIGGTVCGENVLVGMLSFLQDMGVEVPEGIRVDRAVCVSIAGQLCGLFAISYDKTKASAAALGTICSYRRLEPVLVDSDFMLTASFLRSRFGINPKRLTLPDLETRHQLNDTPIPEETPAILLTTRDGLAPLAFGVSGARALRTANRIGLVVHMLGGIIGLGIVLLLALTGSLQYLTPMNLFLFHLVWLIPGLLITNWTKTI